MTAKLRKKDQADSKEGLCCACMCSCVTVKDAGSIGGLTRDANGLNVVFRSKFRRFCAGNVYEHEQEE